MLDKRNGTAYKTQWKSIPLKNDHLWASEENVWKFVFSVESNKSLPLMKQNEKKLRFQRQLNKNKKWIKYRNDYQPFSIIMD